MVPIGSDFEWLAPAGETVLGGLGSLALSEKMTHWRLALRFQKPTSFSVSFLCLLLIDPDVRPQLLVQCHVCLLVACCDVPHPAGHGL